MSRGDRIPFEGMLNARKGDYDVPELLLELCRSNKTGHLVFVNPEGKKNLFVKSGRFIFAEASSQDYQLREFLLKRGTISAWEYNELGKSVKAGKRFGALLVEAGLLTVDELVPAVVGQVTEIILGLFARTETAYSFKEKPLSRHESITLKAPIEQFIVDGILRVPSWWRIAAGVGELQQRYTLDPAHKDRIAGVSLGKQGDELVSLLQTPYNLSELSRLSSLGDFVVGQYLWAFRTLEWVTPAKAETKIAVGGENTAEPTPNDAPPVDEAEPDQQIDIDEARAVHDAVAGMIEGLDGIPDPDLPEDIATSEPTPDGQPAAQIDTSDTTKEEEAEHDDDGDDIAAEIAAAAARLEADIDNETVDGDDGSLETSLANEDLDAGSNAGEPVAAVPGTAKPTSTTDSDPAPPADDDESVVDVGDPAALFAAEDIPLTVEGERTQPVPTPSSSGANPVVSETLGDAIAYAPDSFDTDLPDATMSQSLDQAFESILGNFPADVDGNGSLLTDDVGTSETSSPSTQIEEHPDDKKRREEREERRKMSWVDRIAAAAVDAGLDEEDDLDEDAIERARQSLSSDDDARELSSAIGDEYSTATIGFPDSD